MDTSLHYLTMANQMLIQKRLLERVKASGLTLGQPKVLDYLKDHDGASQKEIAAGCFIEAGSLTSILNRMEEKGLIERRMLNGNRRTFHIFMTESGKKSQKLVEEAFVEIEEAAWKDISPEEAEAFMKIYHKIYSNLSETGCEETGKKEGTNEQTKKIRDLSDRSVRELTWCQPDHQGKSRNLTDLIDSVCIKLKFSVYTRKLYDFFQRISDLTAVTDPA